MGGGQASMKTPGSSDFSTTFRKRRHGGGNNLQIMGIFSPYQLMMVGVLPTVPGVPKSSKYKQFDDSLKIWGVGGGRGVSFISQQVKPRFLNDKQ